MINNLKSREQYRMHQVMQQHQCPLWRYLIHLDGVVILTPRHDVNGMNDAAPPINSSFKVKKKNSSFNSIPRRPSLRIARCNARVKHACRLTCPQSFLTRQSSYNTETFGHHSNDYYYEQYQPIKNFQNKKMSMMQPIQNYQYR